MKELIIAEIAEQYRTTMDEVENDIRKAQADELLQKFCELMKSLGY